MAPPLSATLALGALALVVVLLVAIGKRTKKRGKTSNSRSVWISLNSVRDAVAATEDLSTFKFDSLLSARRKSRHGQVFNDGLYKFVPVLVTDKKGKESNKTLVAYEHRNRSSNVWWWFTVVAGRVTSSLALPDGFRPIDRVDKDGAVFPPRAGELVTFCNSLRALLAAEDAADPPPPGDDGGPVSPAPSHTAAASSALVVRPSTGAKKRKPIGELKDRQTKRERLQSLQAMLLRETGTTSLPAALAEMFQFLPREAGAALAGLPGPLLLQIVKVASFGTNFAAHLNLRDNGSVVTITPDTAFEVMLESATSIRQTSKMVRSLADKSLGRLVAPNYDTLRKHIKTQQRLAITAAEIKVMPDVLGVMCNPTRLLRKFLETKYLYTRNLIDLHSTPKPIIEWFEECAPESPTIQIGLLEIKRRVAAGQYNAATGGAAIVMNSSDGFSLKFGDCRDALLVILRFLSLIKSQRHNPLWNLWMAVQLVKETRVSLARTQFMFDACYKLLTEGITFYHPVLLVTMWIPVVALGGVDAANMWACCSKTGGMVRVFEEGWKQTGECLIRTPVRFTYIPDVLHIGLNTLTEAFNLLGQMMMNLNVLFPAQLLGYVLIVKVFRVAGLTWEVARLEKLVQTSLALKGNSDSWDNPEVLEEAATKWRTLSNGEVSIEASPGRFLQVTCKPIGRTVVVLRKCFNWMVKALVSKRGAEGEGAAIVSEQQALSEEVGELADLTIALDSTARDLGFDGIDDLRLATREEVLTKLRSKLRESESACGGGGGGGAAAAAGGDIEQDFDVLAEQVEQLAMLETAADQVDARSTRLADRAGERAQSVEEADEVGRRRIRAAAAWVALMNTLHKNTYADIGDGSGAAVEAELRRLGNEYTEAYKALGFDFSKKYYVHPSMLLEALPKIAARNWEFFGLTLVDESGHAIEHGNKWTKLALTTHAFKGDQATALMNAFSTRIAQVLFYPQTCHKTTPKPRVFKVCSACLLAKMPLPHDHSKNQKRCPLKIRARDAAISTLHVAARAAQRAQQHDDDDEEET